MRNGVRVLACLSWMVLLAGCQAAVAKQDVKPDEKKTDKPAGAAPAAKPQTHKIEKAPFKIEVTLKGVFESADMVEVALRPEAWSGFSVVKAVEHGTQVRKGDTLVELDLEKIDQAIRDLRTDRDLSDLAIKLAEEELPVLEKTLPLDLAAAERAKKIADEDLKYFREVDRPLSEESAHFNFKMAQESLDYAQEELHQLEKMYKADDLTEETEEIILKRQRRAVERAKFYVKSAEIRRQHTLKVDLPRRDKTVVETAEKAALAWDKSRNTLPLSLNQKRQNLEKMKYDRSKSNDRFAKLQKDREMMVVRAPADGIVYYGKCVRGNWATAAMAATALQRGGNLMPELVFMTIVKSRPLFVRAAVEEKDLQYLRAGAPGKATATANADLKLSAKIDSVTSVPLSPGNFEARIAVDIGANEVLMPGMACTVKLTAYQKMDAIAVTSTAVFADDADEDKQFVYVSRDGKPEKRWVTIGKKSGTKTEIVEGLKEGEEILLEKPKA